MRIATILPLLLFFQLFSYAQTASNIAVIPAPLSVKKEKGNFIFSQLTVIQTSNKVDKSLNFLTAYLLDAWKFKNNIVSGIVKPNTAPTILVITEQGAENLPPEGYKLSVTPTKITLIGKGAGLFYGIQSLIQLFPNEKKGTALLPCVTIVDQPRFGYRGLMLDVSRHFFNVAQIKDLLDLMASYKLNRFHWHLTDDQGWRIEIKSYPKLTEVGAWRVPRKDFGMEAPRVGEKATDGGFYSQDQIREVVRYATERHIEIMPEIDVPGHSMAAIAAYPELSVTKNLETKVNPGSSFARWFPTGGFEMFVDNTLNPTDEKVYQFLDQVFEEVAALFPYEYIHIGGDECFKGYWEKDQNVAAFMKKMNIGTAHELQNYFTARVGKIIRSKNKKPIGWDEIFDDSQNQEVAIMNRFGEKGAIAQTKRKLNIIMAPGNNGLYFDYAQSHSDMEPSSHGQYSPIWKAYNYTAAYNGITNEDKKYILGVEACLWTESIPSVAKLQYMLLPRMLALAETGWTSLANKNYQAFAENALSIHLARFDQKGFNYRVPTTFNYTDTLLIGNEFKFELKAPIVGSKIFYTLNNRFPSEADHEYLEPIVVRLAPNKKSILKTIVISTSGKRSVLTRTVMYNPTIKKSSTITGLNPGLKYKLIQTTTGKIDSGIISPVNLPQNLQNLKNTIIKMEGQILIPKDGYYEFSASNKSMVLTISGTNVFDSDKIYPNFDKPDPLLYLQKGLHSIKIECNQSLTAQTHIFLKELNGKETEAVSADFSH